jgi:hypothetical protein
VKTHRVEQTNSFVKTISFVKTNPSVEQTNSFVKTSSFVKTDPSFVKNHPRFESSEMPLYKLSNICAKAKNKRHPIAVVLSDRTSNSNVSLVPGSSRNHSAMRVVTELRLLVEILFLINQKFFFL